VFRNYLQELPHSLQTKTQRHCIAVTVIRISSCADKYYNHQVANGRRSHGEVIPFFGKCLVCVREPL
jgi:hypothetical protein